MTAPAPGGCIDASVIVVTFNSAADIERCLRSIVDHPPRRAIEIIVVDNGSTDDTVARALGASPLVVVDAAPTNLGFGAANNRAARRATGRVLVFLNPDAIVTPGVIDRLCDTLDDDPTVTAVGPRLVDDAGRAELSFGAVPSPLAEWRQKRLVQGSARGDTQIARAVERMTSESKDVDWVSGACLACRAEDFRRVGGFDERFFMYLEDVDLCVSLRHAGGRVRFDATQTVTHLRGRSRASAQSATERSYRRSQLAFYAKHRPGWVPALRLYLTLRGRLPDT